MCEFSVFPLIDNAVMCMGHSCVQSQCWGWDLRWDNAIDEESQPEGTKKWKKNKKKSRNS